MKVLSLADAVALIPDGASLIIGGFMAVGSPEKVIDELVRQGKRRLTVIANDTAMPGVGIGKLVSFIMEHEKYSYVAALKWLANRYGIEIEETFVNDEQRQQMLAADSLFIINSFAQQFFSRILFETEEGQDVGLAYFKERGFREDIIKKFQLGYSPEQRDGFTKEAIGKQYNTELLIKSGLVANRNNQLVDNYRGHVIIPVHNHSGKVVGFGARILKSNDKAPKYINTPENVVTN